MRAIRARISVVLTGLACCAFEVHAAGLLELTEHAYVEGHNDKGVVLLHINWARKWGCRGSENAQIEELDFTKMLTDEAGGLKPTDLTLTFKNGLLTNNGFQGYALLLDPGSYAISGVEMRKAGSMSNGRYKIGAEQLIKDGKAVGGSFDVAAAEIVYIGHFAVDCGPEATVWRFYIDGRASWEQYLSDVHKKFPYIKDAPVTYRLFATETLGKPYSLPTE
jgi:hypothetical protein